MNKTELIELLSKEGLGSKTALKKKSLEELQELHATLGVKDEISEKEEPLVESTKEVEQSPPKAEGGEIVSEFEYQLNIFTALIYNVRHKGSTVVVENLGGGDAYVSEGSVLVGDKEKRLVFGEKVTIEGANVINLIAASQPTIKITELS